MRPTLRLCMLALASSSCGWSGAEGAVMPTQFELDEAARWSAAKFQAVTDTAKPGLDRNRADPPFAFTYDGKPSAELLKHWKVVRSSRDLDGTHTEHTLTYTDEATRLQVRCVAVAYHDFPTVEWTVYFQNTGPADTPILSDLQALDLLLERPPEGEFVLHHQQGDDCTPNSYAPRRLTLTAPSEHRFAPAGGRPTNQGFPFLQPRMAGGGSHCRRRLARTMGRPVQPRQRQGTADSRRPGVDPLPDNPDRCQDPGGRPPQSQSLNLSCRIE